MMNKKILEALQLQPLSEDEKKARHILGRLYGPIATCKESTRNGRKYNRELWEKALSDDLLKEKIANKSLFLELGHPTDREETDMTKVCACIPELPKIVDDDLYAYVDIIDTTNGRLLKTLCDYGFVPGISSRGSGDVDDYTSEVDPETFYLETWDIVAIPAVKKARLSICESLNTNNSLKKVLTEAYDKSTEKDRKIMKESLDNLHIKLEEDKNINNIDKKDVGFKCDKEICECDKKDIKECDIKECGEGEKVITEANEVLPGGTPKDVSKIPELSIDFDEVTLTEDKEPEEKNDTEGLIDDIKVENTPAEEVPTEEKSDDVKDDTKDEKVEKDIETDKEVTVSNIKELKDAIKEFENDSLINIEPLKIGDEEHAANSITIKNVDGSAVLKIGYDLEIGDNKEVKEPAKVSEISAEQTEENKPDTEKTVIDNEANEVIESLKEAVRKNGELEEKVKSLKKEKTVSDAEVANLKEELTKYKLSFERTSELAAKSKDFEKKIESLTEQVNKQDSYISSLRAKTANTVKLTESVNSANHKVETLTESLNSTKAELESANAKLDEQAKEFNQKLTESNNAAKNYKVKFNAVLNRYIGSKASMLGVKPTDITSRLNEKYTLDDIDNVCEELLTYNLNMSKLPFGIERVNTKPAINESVNSKVNDPDNGYEIDDDLLSLAGLK